MLQNEILECVRRGYFVSLHPCDDGAVLLEVHNRRLQPNANFRHRKVAMEENTVAAAVRECRLQLTSDVSSPSADAKEYTVTFEGSPDPVFDAGSLNADWFGPHPPGSMFFSGVDWRQGETPTTTAHIQPAPNVPPGTYARREWNFPADAVIEPPLEDKPKFAVKWELSEPETTDWRRAIEHELTKQAAAEIGPLEDKPDCASGWTATIGSVDESGKEVRTIEDFTIKSVGLVGDDGYGPWKPVSVTEGESDCLSAIEVTRDSIIKAFGLPEHAAVLIPSDTKRYVRVLGGNVCESDSPDGPWEPVERLPKVTVFSATPDAKVTYTLSKPCPRCNGTREIKLFTGTSPCPDCVEE